MWYYTEWFCFTLCIHACAFFINQCIYIINQVSYNNLWNVLQEASILDVFLFAVNFWWQNCLATYFINVMTVLQSESKQFCVLAMVLRFYCANIGLYVYGFDEWRIFYRWHWDEYKVSWLTNKLFMGKPPKQGSKMFYHIWRRASYT